MYCVLLCLTWIQRWRFWSGHWATHRQLGTDHCKSPPLQTVAHGGPEGEAGGLEHMRIVSWSTYKYVKHSANMWMGLSYLFESAVEVELPPVEMVGVEREVIIFATVACVGQNVAATFCEAKKDVTATKRAVGYQSTANHNNHHPTITTTTTTVWDFNSIPIVQLYDYSVHKQHTLWQQMINTRTYPALRNSSLTMFFKGTQTRGGSFRNRRWENWPDSWIIKLDGRKGPTCWVQIAKSTKALHTNMLQCR